MATHEPKRLRPIAEKRRYCPCVRVVVVILLAVLLSGCRVLIDLEIAFDDGTGGTLALTVSTDEEINAILEDPDDPLSRLLSDAEAGDWAGWEVSEEHSDQGERRVTVATTFSDAESFNDRYQELRSGLDTPEARVLGELTLSAPEDAPMTMTGELPLLLGPTVGLEGDRDVDEITASLQGVVESTVTLRTSGTVHATDAHSVRVLREDDVIDSSVPSDGPAVLTWTVIPGESSTVGATFDQGGRDWMEYALLGLGGLVALGLLLAGVIVSRRNTRRRPRRRVDPTTTSA